MEAGRQPGSLVEAGRQREVTIYLKICDQHTRSADKREDCAYIEQCAEDTDYFTRPLSIWSVTCITPRTVIDRAPSSHH